MEFFILYLHNKYLVAILIPKSSIKFEYIPYHKISLLFLTIWYHRVQLASITHELDYINVSTQFRASPFERALFSALNRVLLIN